MQAAGAECLFLRANFSEQNVQQLPQNWVPDAGISQTQAVMEELLVSLMDA